MSDDRERFSIPRDPEAPEQASGTQQTSTQQTEDGAQNGSQDGQQQATQEESNQQVGGGVGEILEIKGVVIDVRFGEDDIPEIYNALTVEFETEDGSQTDQVTLEVQQIVGDDVVRAIAMGSTDGMKRGLPVKDTGQPIAVPVVGGPVEDRVGGAGRQRGSRTRGGRARPADR